MALAGATAAASTASSTSCQRAARWVRSRMQRAVNRKTVPSTPASGERLAASCRDMGSSATQAKSPRSTPGATATAATVRIRYKSRLAVRPQLSMVKKFWPFSRASQMPSAWAQ